MHTRLRPPSDATALTLLLGVVAILMWLYGGIDYATEPGTDLQWYRPMAQAAPGWDLEMRTPFVYRPLGPWLVGLLPGPDPIGFYVSTLAGLLAVTVLLYVLLRRDDIPPGASALAVGAFAASPYVFGILVYNYFHIGDVLTYILLLLGLLLLYRRRWLGLAVVLALGALTRETVLLLVPTAFVYLWEQDRLRADARRMAMVVGPALALAVALRLLADPRPGGLSLVDSLLVEGVKAFRADTWIRLLLVAWAPLGLWVVVFWEDTVAYVRAHPHRIVFAVLVFVSVFFGYDQERLFGPAFVAVVPLLGVLLARHLLDARAPTGALVGVIAAVMLNVPSHLVARFPLPSRTLTIVLTFTSLGLATLVAVWLRWRSSTASAPTS
ncbi:MAG: hypothetical protein AAGF99_08285 [Bacteroidota bacterium]